MVVPFMTILILAVAALSGVEESNEEVTLRDGHGDLTSTTPYTYNYNLVVDLVRGLEAGQPLLALCSHG